MEVGIGLDLLIHPYIRLAVLSVLFRVEFHPEQVRPQGQLAHVVFASLASKSDDFLYKIFECKIDVPFVSCGIRDYVNRSFLVGF